MASSADSGPTQASLAATLGVSQSNISRALRQLEASHLLINGRIQKAALRRFIEHGVPYAYPAELNGPARGVLTATTPNLLEALGTTAVCVWPYDEGRGSGTALKPLHPCVPGAAIRDPAFHELVALVDVMRIGRVREKRLAGERLDAILGLTP